MAEAAEQLDEEYQRSWSITTPAVRKAIAFIKSQGGSVAVDDLITWDARHGRKLFNWNDTEAAAEWRRQQARMFLNSFRHVIDGLRVRAFINVPANEETGADTRQYVSIEAISDNEQQRTWAIKSIVKRMKLLASELKFWKLQARERDGIIAELMKAMGFEQ